MNLYGYASGDPINNSDPFGLRDCPSGQICPPSLWVAGGMALGGTIGAAAATGCAGVTVGLCTFGGPALVAAGAGLGAAAGGVAQSMVEGGTVLLQAGLSWWDRKKVQIRLIIGNLLTEGELGRHEAEREKAKQEQEADQKARKERKEGGDPPDPRTPQIDDFASANLGEGPAR